MSNSSTQQGMKASMQSFLQLRCCYPLCRGKCPSSEDLRKVVLSLQYLSPARQYCCFLISILLWYCWKSGFLLCSGEAERLLHLGRKSWIFRFSRGGKSPHLCLPFSPFHYPVKNKIYLWMQRPSIAGNADVTFEHPGAANWSLAGTEAQISTS